MNFKFKKLNSLAAAPSRSHSSDAGFDLVAASVSFPSMEDTGLYIEVGTGLSFEIPAGYVGLVFPRSSITKTRHFLRNGVGVIDSGYRGEVKLRFSPDESVSSYAIGDRVGQIIFLKLPVANLIEVKDLSSSTRQEGGFGSSGM